MIAVLFVTGFVTGLTLLLIHARYWQIYLYYDFVEWLLYVFEKYIYMLMLSLTPVSVWIMSATFTTYLFIDKESKVLALRFMLTVLAFCAIVFILQMYMPTFLVFMICASISIFFLICFVVSFCPYLIYKKIKSRQALRIQQHSSREAKVGTTARNGDQNLTNSNRGETNSSLPIGSDLNSTNN
jgi:hypothetical protein